MRVNGPLVGEGFRGQPAAARRALMAAFLAWAALPSCGGRTQPGGPPPGAVRDRGSGIPDWSPTADWTPFRLDRGVPGKDKQVSKLDKGAPPKLDGPTGTCVAQGGVCSSGGACCPGFSCTPLPTGLAICTLKCTPDNPSTPLVNEDSCKSGNICGNINYPGQDYYCLRLCTPALGGNPCPPGLACHPASAAFTGATNKAVCAYGPCTTSLQCPVRLAKTCALGGPPSECSNYLAGSVCAAGGNNLSYCTLPGVCDPASGLCGPHKYGKASAKVGDPCDDDRSCGNQMFCERQSASPNVPGATHARNGYCMVSYCAFPSLTAFQCPAGSACSSLYYGGRCFKTCDLKQAGQCRGNALDKYGDYECRAWNNLSMGSLPVTASPVCELGDTAPCTLFGGAAGLDCSALGLTGNPTDMACRDPKTGAKLPANSPAGLCLDNTASGN